MYIFYQYNIAYEYALKYCKGETVKDKVIDYLKSMDFVSEYYLKWNRMRFTIIGELCKIWYN